MADTIDVEALQRDAERAKQTDRLTRGVEEIRTSGGPRFTFTVISPTRDRAKFYLDAPDHVLSLLSLLASERAKREERTAVIEAARVMARDGWCDLRGLRDHEVEVHAAALRSLRAALAALDAEAQSDGYELHGSADPVPMTAAQVDALLSANPLGACDTCGRKTWSSDETVCLMPQPDGSRCAGLIVRAALDAEEVKP